MESLPNNLISQRVCWIKSSDPVKYEYGIIRLIYRRDHEILCAIEVSSDRSFLIRSLLTLKAN